MKCTLLHPVHVSAVMLHSLREEFSDHSRQLISQRETTLHCKSVFHWLSSYPELCWEVFWENVTWYVHLKLYPIIIIRDNVRIWNAMMTSSNGNIFRVTGPLCGEFTGTGEFPTQRPVTRSFDVYFDLRLNKRLSKQLWGWWFETLSRSLWRHRNAFHIIGLVRKINRSAVEFPLTIICQWCRALVFSYFVVSLNKLLNKELCR